MKIDAHNHIGKKKGVSVSVDDFIKSMDEAGIDKAVVFSFSEQIDNDYVIESVKRYPDRLFGFVTINPWSTTSEEDLEKAFSTDEIYGLKLHPVKHAYALDDHSLLDPLFKICEKYNKPVLVHGQSDMFNMPGKFDEMAETFPNVTLIMAHIGEPDAIDAAIRVAKRRKNVYIDTASVQLSTLKKALKEIDPNKILMGTDAPWGDFTLSIDLVKKATDDIEIQNKILGENIVRVLNWKK